MKWRASLAVTLTKTPTSGPYTYRDEDGRTEEYRAEIPAETREDAVAGAAKILAAIGEASK